MWRIYGIQATASFIIFMGPLALLFILGTPLARRLGTPPWISDVFVSLRDGRTTHHSVWTNLVYLFPAWFAWFEPWTMAMVYGSGFFVALGSAVFHTTGARRFQRFDVAAIFPFIASVLAACWAHLGWAVWLIVPLAAGVYSVWTWEINSFVHGPLWAAIVLGSAVWVAGWVAAWAAAPVLIGIAFDQFAGEGEHHWGHSLWHVGAAASMAWILYLV